MPVYASFDYYPGHYPYLTPGKLYETRPHETSNALFYMTDDVGDELICKWTKCGFLSGTHDWIRHDEPDAEPTPELTADRDTATTDEFVLRRAPNGGWIVDDGMEDFACGATILAAYSNTDDLLAGLRTLLGGAR